MKYDYLIFDLDGTISDPKRGIVKSINHALKFYKFNERGEDELSKYIGPPIDITFANLTLTDDSELISSLISKYRERYSKIGFSENELYPDVVNSLKKLSLISGLKLGICTSKRVDFAEKILELFSIRKYFSFVNGGDVGIEKWEQLKDLIQENVINYNSLMIGDRDVDLIAAHKNKLQSAGVLWGYGDYDELIQHKPFRILSSPSELASLAV